MVSTSKGISLNRKDIKKVSHNNTVLDGPLTPREIEVLADLLLGHTNQQIADSLGISIETVKLHLYRIFTKYGVDNRVALALRAKERNGEL